MHPRDRIVNLIQFLPYFPPHTWGLEDVAEWISSEYMRAGYGKVLNVTFSVGQTKMKGSYETADGSHVVILPAFDLVKNFPVPKIWSFGFWSAFREIKTFWGDIIQTHTRFFLSSFVGGIYAKWHRKKWVHIEHGSGYVVSEKKLITVFSQVFDRTIGKWILTHADEIIAISEACKTFVLNEFIHREITVIYRGMEVPKIPKIPATDGKIRITFIGRLVYLKGVSFLLEALERLIAEGITNFSCRIVGDGEMRKELERTVIEHSLESYIEFLGFRSKAEVLWKILPSTDIFVNPSLQEGLPTTVVEALLSGCVVIATDVGGTREISEGEDIIIVPPENTWALVDGLKSMMISSQKVAWISNESVRLKFDSRGNMEKMYELYANILKITSKKL